MDGAVVAEHDHADIVGLEVQREAAGAVFELDHLARFDLVEAVDAGDAVTDRKHAADLGHLGLGPEIRDLLLEDGRDLGRSDIHQRSPLIDNSRFCSLVLSDASTMREPMRRTTPPSSAASTAAVSWTGRPA